MPRLWIICLGLCLGLALWLGLALRSAAQPNVTGYPKMTAHLKADAARCPLVRLTSLGKSAHGHRDLWLVRLAAPAADPARTIRVLVLCRQHGDEPASTEAVLGLIHRLAVGGDPSLRAALLHVTLYLVPMVNPDGAEADTRASGVGADLNRDWGVFHQPETRAVARAARLLRPNLVIDAHNWDGDDEYNADCLEIPRERTTPLGDASHALQQQAVRDLAACGYSVHPTAWGADTDPRLAHRWFARQRLLSALVETHSGSPADVADFQRRQGLYAALLHGLVRRYAASYVMEKPRLDALEGDAKGDVREASLFPPLPAAASRRLSVALRPHSFAWLWAIGVYGLALWGAGLSGSLRADCPRQRRQTKRRQTKEGRGDETGRGDPAPTRRRAGVGEDPLAAYGLFALPSVKPVRYSGAKKRDGTDTRVRSGQRKAVSSPPR